MPTKKKSTIKQSFSASSRAAKLEAAERKALGLPPKKPAKPKKK